MSKHVIDAIDPYDRRTVWLLPDPGPDPIPGSRIRLDKGPGNIALLVEEHVFMDSADNPKANVLNPIDGPMCLSREQATWLRDALSEMLEEWEP